MALQSCVDNKSDTEKRIIAKAYDKNLYYEDIAEQLPVQMLKKDSAEFVKKIIDKWITDELIAKKAETNLIAQQTEIDRQVEEYRNALIIFKYQQNYISQNLDTNITHAQLEKYYRQFAQDFSLGFEAIKGLFIKIAKNTPDVYKIRSWYRSEDENKARKLDVFCNKYAEIYEDFDGDWTNFEEITKQMPFNFSSNEMFLKYNSFYETNDSLYRYYLNITDYKLKNDTAPLVFVKENIKKIIINKRKIQLVKELEKNLYQDALSSGKIKIY